MGTRISIDKHVSKLEDILELNPKTLSTIRFENSIPDSITQHLKIWKFQDEDLKKVQSEPVNLSQIQDQGFNFLSNECYVVLLIYRKSHEDCNVFLSFPHQMWGVVESYSNLTPRGLEFPIASSEDFRYQFYSKEIFDSFLIPKRNGGSEFEYMVFAWNGKQANPLVKAQALSNAFELENLLNKGKDQLLKILFNGGVIKNKKLSKGSIVQLASQATSPVNQEVEEEQEQQVRETVYLFNFLFPQPPAPQEKKREFSKLSDFLNKSKENIENNKINYTRKFKKIACPKITETPSSKPNIFTLSNYMKEEQNIQEEEVCPQVVPKLKIENNKNKVPSLNFKQLPLNDDVYDGKDTATKTQDEKTKVRIPKMDLNLKNVSPQESLSSQRKPMSSSREVDIGVPLIEGVEYSDIEKIEQGEIKLSLNLNPIQKLPLQQNAMKLSLGNLKQMNQRDDATYLDIINEDKQGFNFDIRDTDRRKLKIQYFAEICSEVIQNLLYVGGEQIAYNYDYLKEIGITHLINCAGDVCINKFPQDFHYMTYYLKDSKTENIECIFYEVIQMIDKVKEQNGKVLIHCVQGVSRSVSLCIAYLIFKQKITYSSAFDLIKKSRGVASPNMGFTVQLLLFQKRLQSSFDSIPVSPRVFAVGRGVQGNNNVVCRMLMEQMYAGKIVKTLDSRGVFLIQSEDALYIWIGPECLGNYQEKSIQYALQYLNLLQMYENANQNLPVILKASEEPQQFWQLWGFQDVKPPLLWQRIKEWDEWYMEIDEVQFLKEKQQSQIIYSKEAEENFSNRNQDDDIRQEQEQQRTQNKPLLFIFPNIEQPLGIFDLEDLDSQSLCLLLKENEEILQVFIWKGNLWNSSDDEERNFVDEIINKHYQHMSHENIFIYKEEPNEESEEFLDCFS